MEFYQVIILVACIIAGLALLLCLAEFLYAHRVVRTGFGCHSDKEPDTEPEKSIPLMGEDFPAMCAYTNEQTAIFNQNPFERIEVKTDDGLTLRGKFYRSLNPDAKVTVICSHGYRSSSEWDFGGLCNFLIENYNVVFVSHRGHNASDGNRVTFGIKDSLDMKKWVEKTALLTPECKIVLLGDSMGAATVLMASDTGIDDKVSCIVSDCGYDDGDKQMAFMIRSSHVPVQPMKAFCRFWFYCYNGFALDSRRAIDSVKKTNIPILFIHGTADKFVPFEMGKRLYDACKSEKEYLWVEGAGHVGSFFKQIPEYKKRLSAFIDKHTK
jgi:hypothetical protein